MKRITIPEPVRFTRGDPDPTTKQPIIYTAQTFLREFVWPSPKWVESEDAQKALRRLHKALDPDEVSGTPGATVDISDADHERALPLFKLEGVTLNPIVAYEVREIAYAFCWPQDVDSAPPKEPKEQP